MDIFDPFTVGLIVVSLCIGILLGAGFTGGAAYSPPPAPASLVRPPSPEPPLIDKLWREAVLLADTAHLCVTTSTDGRKSYFASIEARAGDCSHTYAAIGETAADALAKATHLATSAAWLAGEMTTFHPGDEA